MLTKNKNFKNHKIYTLKEKKNDINQYVVYFVTLLELRRNKSKLDKLHKKTLDTLHNIIIVVNYVYRNMEGERKMKKILSIAICVCIIAGIFCGFALSASAENDYFCVKLDKGDTVCSVCTANGINYEKNKNLIMVLNNMTKESELSALCAGSVVKLPTHACMNGNSIISNDKIKYYVIPYVIEQGDTIAHVYWLWGLRFENYQEDIKALNGKDDLDILWVGTTYLLPTTEANVKTGNYTTVMSHLIQSGETAYDVFSAYGIDYHDNQKLLEKYNQGKDLTKLSAGSELLIPLI